jgi:L-Ala-D/L-Glu epimerase
LPIFRGSVNSSRQVELRGSVSAHRRTVTLTSITRLWTDRDCPANDARSGDTAAHRERTSPVARRATKLTDRRDAQAMPDHLTIATVEIFPVRLPLTEPFVISYGAFPDAPTVLVRLRTTEGAEGWGEATPDALVTGETYHGTAETLRRDLAPALLGRDARDREAILHALDARVEGVPAAKAALDIALHDLLGKASGLPVWGLLGGRSKPNLTISRVVSLGEPAAMAEAAARHVAAGFRTVKVKVGEGANWREDVRRLAAVREAVGPEIGIKVDVNQGWRTAGLAIAATRECLASRPDHVEQPVAQWDIEGLAEVRRQTGATIMADEACHGPREALRIAQLRAADLINIKLMKCGGLFRAFQLNAVAETAGIVCQVGTMVESSIASAAGLHLALALANVRTVEMGGPLMLAADVGDARTWYDRDTITPPDAPGLGIAVDEAAVERFAEARWMVTE